LTKDVILADLILKKAKEKHFKVNIFDPTGLMTQGTPGSIQELQVDVTKAEKDKVEAAVTNGITTKEYHVSRQGQIEQIKFVEQNVRLYATDANDAKNISHLSGSSLLHKAKRTFPNACGYGITKAHIRLTWKNLSFERFCFEDNRQRPIKQISDNNNYEIVFEFSKTNAPSAITKVPINNKEFKMFLKDSGYIKPDDPAIRQQLVDIRGDEKDAYVIAESIIKWTSSNIKFTLNAPFLSGPELLEKRTGHCTHYSILFASLARAAGIPTKIVTGLLNIKADRHLWGAHMWNEVWVGEWIAVDPTRGEFVTGPSHIKLAEAPTIIELQGAISRLENNLSLEILDFTKQE
jgi:transglutaminase-like putative cysteine protease